MFSKEFIDLNFQNALLSSLPRQLLSDQSSLCEGAMTIDEISFGIKNMNTNKSPGPHGLPLEFY